MTSHAAALPLLSVIVLTLNEEANLPACLESLADLDCDVFVVDSGSTDGTVQIARARGARVLGHPFENYAAQRNWAQRNLPLRTNWVLHLDADERLTYALVEEINALLHSPPAGVNGFMLRKRTIFMGRWIRHGGHYPSYHLRLFKRERGTCEERLYDQHFIVDGSVGELQHDYVDVVTSDLTTWTTRHARWAELEAREMLGPATRIGRMQGKLRGTPIERRRWLRDTPYRRSPLFWRALFYWLYRYVIRRGFLDGTEGAIFHFLQGFWYRLLIDAKLHEWRGANRTPGAQQPIP